MFGRKSARIADLEARNELLVHQVADLRETANAWEWAAHRADDLLTQQDRQRILTRANTQTALAAERARTSRYRTAWLSARRGRGRQRDQVAADSRVIHRLTGQLFDAMGYSADARALLDGVPCPLPTPRTAAELAAASIDAHRRDVNAEGTR